MMRHSWHSPLFVLIPNQITDFH